MFEFVSGQTRFSREKTDVAVLVVFLELSSLDPGG